MASDAPVLGLKPSSSSSGLRKVFSKNKARNNSAAVSGEDSLQPRNSLDSTERSPNRKSTDSGHDGSISSGKAAIGKLIPGRSRKSRRRRASELKESDAEIQRGRLADTPSPSTTPQPQQSLNESTSSLLNDTESNLLTDDSEPEKYVCFTFPCSSFRILFPSPRRMYIRESAYLCRTRMTALGCLRNPKQRRLVLMAPAL